MWPHLGLKRVLGKTFKAKTIEPAPAWKFVGSEESSPIFETLSFKLENDFKSEGSRLAGSCNEPPAVLLDGLERKRKYAAASARTMMILEAQQKLLSCAATSDPTMNVEVYRALFQRCLALTTKSVDVSNLQPKQLFQTLSTLEEVLESP